MEPIPPPAARTPPRAPHGERRPVEFGVGVLGGAMVLVYLCKYMINTGLFDDWFIDISSWILAKLCITNWKSTCSTLYYTDIISIMDIFIINSTCMYVQYVYIISRSWWTWRVQACLVPVSLTTRNFGFSWPKFYKSNNKPTYLSPEQHTKTKELTIQSKKYYYYTRWWKGISMHQPKIYAAPKTTRYLKMDGCFKWFISLLRNDPFSGGRIRSFLGGHTRDRLRIFSGISGLQTFSLERDFWGKRLEVSYRTICPDFHKNAKNTTTKTCDPERFI